MISYVYRGKRATMSLKTEYVRDVLVDAVPCGFTYQGRGCEGNDGAPSAAVHVLLKQLPVALAETPLCGYHSPFDH